jgi:23S rRNA-/tRNA-specific pseudouridylate synthase
MCTAGVASDDLVDIVWEDEHYYFVNKPAGVSVVGEENKPSFHDLVKAHARSCYGEQYQPNLLHRLDKGTSGLMVYAKSSCAAKHYLQLQDGKHKGAITKDYLAVVDGIPPKTEGRIVGSIAKSKDKLTFVVNRKQRRNNKRSKEVLTTYRVLATHTDKYAAATAVGLLSMRLFTGRKHQIRASCRKLGCSIIGDTRYGGGPHPSENLKGVQRRMMLHSHRVMFVGLPGSGPPLISGPPRSYLEQMTRAKSLSQDQQMCARAEVQTEGKVYDICCEPQPTSLWDVAAFPTAVANGCCDKYQ